MSADYSTIRLSGGSHLSALTRQILGFIEDRDDMLRRLSYGRVTLRVHEGRLVACEWTRSELHGKHFHFKEDVLEQP